MFGLSLRCQIAYASMKMQLELSCQHFISQPQAVSVTALFQECEVDFMMRPSENLP